MSIISYGFDDAQQNYRNSRYSRWHRKENTTGYEATARVGHLFAPGFTPRFKVRKTDKIFTIGSCFAREVEVALSALGMSALSLPGDAGTSGFSKSGFVNRYNTASILNELRWATGEESFPDDGFALVDRDSYIDLFSHPLGGAKTLALAKAERSALTSYFRRFLDADVVTVTLGLIECWYDKLQGRYINIAPIFGDASTKRPLLNSEGRYEFAIMSYQENAENLREILALIRRHNPAAKIILTVSPVSLMATFSGRDVVTANCHSKSVLRACAEERVLDGGEGVDYFPSYEIALHSDRKLVYEQDGMHIRRNFVHHIMSTFIDSYVDV